MSEDLKILSRILKKGSLKEKYIKAGSDIILKTSI